MQPKSPDDTKAENENTDTRIHVSGEDTASGRDVDLSAEQVRQGHTGDHLRGILVLSFIGAVIALIAAFVFFKP